MIVSVAIDPFAQQILAYPSNQVRVSNPTNFAQASHEWIPTPIITNGVEITDVVPVAMQIAIVRGLSGLYNHLDPVCSSGTCDYPDFVSLGICSSCEDVTSQSHQACVVPTGDTEKLSPPTNCTYTSPNGFNITPDVAATLSTFHGSQGGPGGPGRPLYLIEAEVSWDPWTSIVTSNTSYAGTIGGMTSEAPGPIVSFFGAKSVGSTTWVTDNVTATGPKPTLTECSVYWCERLYSNNHVSPSSSWLNTSNTQNLYVESVSVFDLVCFAPVQQ